LDQSLLSGPLVDGKLTTIGMILDMNTITNQIRVDIYVNGVPQGSWSLHHHHHHHHHNDGKSPKVTAASPKSSRLVVYPMYSTARTGVSVTLMAPLDGSYPATLNHIAHKAGKSLAASRINPSKVTILNGIVYPLETKGAATSTNRNQWTPNELEWKYSNNDTTVTNSQPKKKPENDDEDDDEQ
jgi:hypothetical protein